ncbi:MAG TPA: metallophosphoesterase, partial [Elusimicrobiales bacterium]|nr:metallophosphoesterase [Elusimicrobiales bacterium]
MKKIPVVISFILLSLVPGLSALTISVYHTSDVHGWYSPRPAKWDKENSTRSVGGFPAFASLIEADKNPRILLDSGDTFQGTPEGTLTRGLASAALMNELGYSAAVVGNHEYDYGEDVIRQMVTRSSFPWLGANVAVKKSGTIPDYLKPYTIIERGGKK